MNTNETRFLPPFNYARAEIARAGGGSSSIDYACPVPV